MIAMFSIVAVLVVIFAIVRVAMGTGRRGGATLTVPVGTNHVKVSTRRSR